MEYSLYNHLVALEDGCWALYNFRTGRCMRLNYFSKQVYDSALALGASHEGVKNLLRYGFLVDFDEKTWMKAMCRASQGRTDGIGLCICPTMACNFSCPYCFETPRGGRMDPETQAAVIRFVCALVKDAHPRSLSVTWFGGEPMLEMGIIRDLSGQLLRLCGQEQIEYSANIVTNGWFMTPENVRILEECRVSEAQITLDGPCAEVNDRTRRPRGGTGSFDRILGNLRTVRTAMRFSIRCNVLRENEARYPELAELMLGIARETGNTIRVSPARAETGLNPERECSCGMSQLTVSEFAKLAGEARTLKDRLRFKGSYCMSQRAYSFCIDERGALSKCWETVGRDTRSFGNVADFALHGNPDGRIRNMLAFLDTAWPGEDSECMRCKVLPVCMGGCPNRRLTTGTHRCEPVKYCMDEYVRRVYEAVYAGAGQAGEKDD